MDKQRENVSKCRARPYLKYHRIHKKAETRHDLEADSKAAVEKSSKIVSAANQCWTKADTEIR